MKRVRLLCYLVLCVSRAVLSVVLGAWAVRFVGWADWVDCSCFLLFVFLGVARRLELSPCNTLRTTLESCQDLIAQWFHDIRCCEYEQMINPDEYDASTMLANVQSRTNVTSNKVKITQQLCKNFVPFPCCLFQAIQCFP